MVSGIRARRVSIISGGGAGESGERRVEVREARVRVSAVRWVVWAA